MFRGVLLDIDGVIYVGDKAVPGALDALSRLNDAGLPYRLITNTTRTPRKGIVERLSRIGVNVDVDDVLTPAAATMSWLREKHLKPHLLVHPDLEPEFAGAPETGNLAVVVGDAGDAFTYDSINRAFRALLDGAEFVALAANRTFKDHDGKLSIDAGAFVAALEFATRREATVLGKPAPAFFNAGLRSMSVGAGDAVMVGDDAEADVSGALAAGLAAGILVRTGKYHAGAEDEVDPRPTHVADDLGSAVDWIIERIGDQPT